MGSSEQQLLLFLKKIRQRVCDTLEVCLPGEQEPELAGPFHHGFPTLPGSDFLCI